MIELMLDPGNCTKETINVNRRSATHRANLWYLFCYKDYNKFLVEFSDMFGLEYTRKLLHPDFVDFFLKDFFDSSLIEKKKALAVFTFVFNIVLTSSLFETLKVAMGENGKLTDVLLDDLGIKLDHVFFSKKPMSDQMLSQLFNVINIKTELFGQRLFLKSSGFLEVLKENRYSEEFTKSCRRMFKLMQMFEILVQHFRQKKT